MSHHRVEFVKVGNNLLNLRNRLALRLCKSFNVLFVGRYKLVKGRVKETEGNGLTFQSFHKSFEVRLLHRLDFSESRLPFFNRIRANHFAERAYSRGVEEHMLRTAKTYALRAERRRLLGVRGGVRIGSYAERLVFIGKFHNSAEVSRVGVCGNGGDKAIVNIARGAVEGNAVALVVNFTRKREALVFFVHLYVAATGYAARTHTAGNYRRVRGLSAANGQDTLRVLHTLDIFGGSFKTYQNYLLALLALYNRVLGGKYNRACRRAGGSRYTLADNVFLVGFL